MGWGVDELTARVILNPADFRADESFLFVAELLTVRVGTVAFLLELLLLFLALRGGVLVVVSSPNSKLLGCVVWMGGS